MSIPLPFKGVAVTWFARATDYLNDTASPETLVRMGTIDRSVFRRSILGTIYPHILENESMWDSQAMAYGRGPNAEVETLLAFKDLSIFLGGSAMVQPLERVGLPIAGLRFDHRSYDSMLMERTRLHGALSDKKEKAEALIFRYRDTLDNLEEELRSKKLDSRPRVLYMTSMTHNKRLLWYWNDADPFSVFFVRAGLENAVSSTKFTENPSMVSPDAERILLTDPDMIFLHDSAFIPNKQSPAEFMADPRWHGMRAVAMKRVYRLPTSLPVDMRGIGLAPVMVRLMAELAHPDQLQPKVRTMLRDFIFADFGYRMSEDEIDAALKLDENGGSAGFERFTRTYQKQP